MNTPNSSHVDVTQRDFIDDLMHFAFIGLIFFMPYIFAWFTLRRRYSKTFRRNSFIWMGVLVTILLLAGGKGEHSSSASEASSSGDISSMSINEIHEYGMGIAKLGGTCRTYANRIVGSVVSQGASTETLEAVAEAKRFGCYDPYPK